MLQDRNWWRRPAAVAAIASACRSQGRAVLGPMLAVVYFCCAEDRQADQSQTSDRGWGLGLISEIGLALLRASTFSRRFHAPFCVLLEAQRHWHCGANIRTRYCMPLNPFNNAPWGTSGIFRGCCGRWRGKNMDWPHLWESICVFAPPNHSCAGPGRPALIGMAADRLGVFWVLLPYVSNSVGRIARGCAGPDGQIVCIGCRWGRFPWRW